MAKIDQIRRELKTVAPVTVVRWEPTSDEVNCQACRGTGCADIDLTTCPECDGSGLDCSRKPKPNLKRLLGEFEVHLSTSPNMGSIVRTASNVTMKGMPMLESFASVSLMVKFELHSEQVRKLREHSRNGGRFWLIMANKTPGDFWSHEMALAPSTFPETAEGDTQTLEITAGVALE